MARLIPYPKTIHKIGGTVVAGNASGDDIYGESIGYFNAARAFLYGTAKGEEVKLITDKALAEEAYRIDCSDGISIYASSVKGAYNALSTLIELMAEYGDGRIDAVTVEDAPDFSFRGLMVDVARVRHPVESIFAYIDLCRLYNLSYLHLHFTDDTLFTLPSDKFGKVNASFYYDKDEIRAITEYARANGIEILPEVDIPGHSFILRYFYPEIFGEGALIEFTERSVSAVKDIIDEVCRLFLGSGRIHIGADEACLDGWLTDEGSLAYARAIGLEGEGKALAERMLAEFIKIIAERVHENGRIPLVWEGFTKATNGVIPKYVEVCAFETFYQTADSLIDDGFSVINCSWVPNYLVTPTIRPETEKCFQWDPYTYVPVSDRSPYYGKKLEVVHNLQTKGGEFLSWGDNGVNKDVKTHLLTELSDIKARLPFTAEGLWNKEKQCSFAEEDEARRALDNITNKLVSRHFDNIDWDRL